MSPCVLIVCEHASNKFGGEAMLPLNYFLLLSQRLPRVFLLTHERTRKDIEAIPDVHLDRVFYIPDTWMHKMLHAISLRLPDRVALITSGALLHMVTQFYQWRMARRIVREHGVDIVHEPAPVSPRQPSMMFFLGVPVVIGPMNGGMTFPPAFSYMAGKAERWMYRVMRLFSDIYNVLIPGKLFASLLLVANQRTRDALPVLRLGTVGELVENGVFSSKVRSEVKAHASGEAITVLYVGRLVDWKAIDVVIDAIARCAHPHVKLVVVGSGVERARLQTYADLVAPGKVTFLGAVPHAEIMACYDDADIFVLPSVRECGGAVVLEAMARGLPVIATNWGGPADYISSETGVLVEPVSREFMVDAFARNIEKLAADADLRQKCGRAALNRVRSEFLWENKVDSVIGLYRDVVDEGRPG